jgi:hypothetical protein
MNVRRAPMHDAGRRPTAMNGRAGTSFNTGLRVDWPATRRKLLDAERELRRLREAVARRRELQKTAAGSSPSEHAVAPRVPTVTPLD